MDAAGIRHLLAVVTRTDAMSLAASLAVTGYLRGVQLYFADAMANRGIDQLYDDLVDGGVVAWYAGLGAREGAMALNGWWRSRRTPTAVPRGMYVSDDDGRFQTQDPSTCALMLGEVDSRDNATLSLSGKGSGVLIQDPPSIEWEDGDVWTRLADPSAAAIKAALLGALGTTPVSRGALADEFIRDVWEGATLGPDVELAPVLGDTGPAEVWEGFEDLDGNRTTLASFSPLAFDGTVAVAVAIDAMVRRGEDFRDGELLFEEILSTSFEGLSVRGLCARLDARVCAAET